MLRNGLLILGLSLFTHLACAQQQQDMDAIAQAAQIPGLQAVYSKNGVNQNFVYGHQTAGAENAITPQTIFQAASLSKVLAGYAFLKLADKGVYDLDTPLSEYFEYERLSEEPAARKITGRMVLNHTSGLLNWQTRQRNAQWLASKLKLQFEPGERFLYSGEGFYYLQLTLEHLTGKSLQQIAEEEVFVPLGMPNSAFVWRDNFAADAATGHREDGTPYNPRHFDTPNAAYTLLTTAEDYSTFVQKGMMKGEGLKPETFSAMNDISSRVPQKGRQGAPSENIAAGLGVRLQFNEKGKALWHTGSNTGFRCFFVAYPESGESLVVLTNSNSGRKTMKDLVPLFFGSDQTYWLLD